jgi:hypothetical protein
MTDHERGEEKQIPQIARKRREFGMTERERERERKSDSSPAKRRRDSE